MITFIKRTALILGGLYLVTLAALYTLQRHVLYIPPNIYLTPAGVGLNGAVEVIDPAQPENILGWWMPPKDEMSPVVIFFHGNGSAVYSNHDIYKRLHAEGFGVFAPAYPGYPGNIGVSTQEALTEAAQRGYQYLISEGIAESNIVFYGTSLGAGVAAQLSTWHRPALIVMEAPFTSAADMAQMRFPIFPASLLTKDKFYSDKALAESNIPMIWIHGTQDRVIPIHVGQSLYDGYDGPKSSMIIDGGYHNNLWYLGGDQFIVSALSKLSGEDMSEPAE